MSAELLALFDLPGASAAPARGPRYGVSCWRCGEWFFSTSPDAHRAPCPICSGRLQHRGTVGDGGEVGYDALVSVCDDTCTSARGVACECRCGGKNHGSGRMVVVHVVAGTARLELENTRLAARIAARRLPELEACERIVAEIDARGAELAADLRAKRAAGTWLPGQDFATLLRVDRANAEARRAMTLRTPAGRMAALRRALASLA